VTDGDVQERPKNQQERARKALGAEATATAAAAGGGGGVEGARRRRRGWQRPPCQGVQRNDMPPIAPRRRPFRPHFTHLYRLVLTRSRASECLKANHFLTYLALLVGPEALSRPATAQNSRGRGRPPPCAAPRPPAGLCPAGKLRLRRKIEGSHSTRRTALKKSAKGAMSQFPSVVYPLIWRSLLAARQEDSLSAFFWDGARLVFCVLALCSFGSGSM
jgi:hypothetical protein